MILEVFVVMCESCIVTCSIMIFVFFYKLCLLFIIILFAISNVHVCFARLGFSLEQGCSCSGFTW